VRGKVWYITCKRTLDVLSVFISKTGLIRLALKQRSRLISVRRVVTVILHNAVSQKAFDLISMARMRILLLR